MPSGAPAAMMRSHRTGASSLSTLISKANSPLKLTRNTRTGNPAKSPERAAMKGKSAGPNLMSPSRPCNSFRLFGPTKAKVAQRSDTEVR